MNKYNQIQRNATANENGGGAVSAPADNVDTKPVYESELTRLGSVREFADKECQGMIDPVVKKSMLTDNPVVYFKKVSKRADGTTSELTAVVLSQSAGKLYPIGSTINIDNLYVQERKLKGESALIITTSGGNVTWVSTKQL